jgi:branched-chain amino acid transport system permease protein
MHVLIQSIIDGLALGAIYAIAGVTFGLIYDITKVFHLAFGAIGTLGTYVAVSVAGGSGGLLTLLASAALGMLAAAAATVIVVVLVYQPLVKRGADPGITFVSSLGLGFIIQSGVVLAFGPANRSFAVDSFVRQRDVLGFGVSPLYWVMIIVAGIVAFIMASALNHTRTGHQVRAIASNREHAQLVGIPAGILATAACAAAAALSVIAFILLGMKGSVVATGGTQLTLFAVLAVLAGGVGSIRGTVTIGFGIGLLGGISSAIFPGEWSTTVVFLAMVILILGRPSGLVRAPLGATS